MTNNYKIGNMYLDSNDELWFVKEDFLGLEDTLESFFICQKKNIDARKDMKMIGNVYDFIKNHIHANVPIVEPKKEIYDEVVTFPSVSIPDTIQEMLEIFEEDKNELNEKTVRDEIFQFSKELKSNQRIGNIYWDPVQQKGWILSKRYALNYDYYLLSSLKDATILELKDVDRCIFIGNILDENLTLKNHKVTDFELDEYRHNLCMKMKSINDRHEASLGDYEEQIQDLEEGIECTIYRYYDHPCEALKESLQEYYLESIRELQNAQEMYFAKKKGIQKRKKEIQKFEQHQKRSSN